ncbi:MAG: DNA mismatch repair endonuclease MutL [Planctomycetota bacterium]|nr:DNA mismatch repair endonuclease MutL [Planctomycetota bacterium]
MTRIQQLDAHVVNRIAAGEVIERPASVVKELLENSVDALSTRIEVDIVNGGMDLIRISDNGEGIHPDDMLLAVTSHATSKIRSDSDLDHVSTLGFRGEALASIASVAKFRIRTRPDECIVGRELDSHGGKIVTNRECGCPAGTVMEVHNLFFNTPARRRFLKKGTTEFGHIAEHFSRIALANPRLHMVLRHNDKLVYELPAAAEPLERIRRFFGSEVADQLIAVSSESELPSGEKIRLWGYVGSPTLSRSTRKDQFLFLNGRWIQDRSLQHALAEAYRGLLMVGRHPVSFLFLEIPPTMVDVNVHPNKSEVRFQDSQLLYRQMLKTLRDRFLTLEFRSNIEVPGGGRAAVGNSNELRFDRPSAPSPPQKELDLWASHAAVSSPPRIGEFARSSSNDRAVFTNPDVIAALAVEPHQRRGASEPGSPSTSFDDTNPGDTAGRTTTAVQDIPESSVITAGAPTEMKDADSESVATAPSLDSVPTISDLEQVLNTANRPNTDEFRAFQIHDCYLVVASEAGLEVIDQHALHERILYEHLRKRILSGGVERQRLLIPESIECSATECVALLESLDLLKEIGFELQEFGGTTILLMSHPTLIPRGNLIRIVKDFAEQLIQKDGKMNRRDLLDHMLHTMSCRAAIKSGQRLSLEEMQELLRQRHLVDDSHHCPHGRPTALTLSRGTLDQQFGRLG